MTGSADLYEREPLWPRRLKFLPVSRHQQAPVVERDGGPSVA